MKQALLCERCAEDMGNNSTVAQTCQGRGAPARIMRSAAVRGPTNRIMTLTPNANEPGKQQITVTLAALEKPEANGYLVVKILHCGPNGAPVCGDPNQFFTVEFRTQAGWDVNISQPTVLIHEVFTGGRPAYVPGKPPVSWWVEYLKTRVLEPAPANFLQAIPVAEFLPGGPTAAYSASSTLFTLHPPANPPLPPPAPDPSSPVSIAVQTFNTDASTATVLVTY